LTEKQPDDKAPQRLASKKQDTQKDNLSVTERRLFSYIDFVQFVLFEKMIETISLSVASTCMDRIVVLIDTDRDIPGSLCLALLAVSIHCKFPSVMS